MPSETKLTQFSLDQLALIIKAESTESLEGSFAAVNIDSRTARSGDCFFAISGENFDGHEYVAEAFAKGAVCAVVNKDTTANGMVLRVKCTVKALGDLAREYRRRMGFDVVAITGSVGKTTTRQIAYHVLSQHFRVSQAPKNFNNNIGLPLTLLGADPQDKIVVAEIGSSYPGEIAYLSQIAAPDVAVVTNVHPAHLAGFGDVETILQEKLSIAEALPSDGVLIINGDLEHLRIAAKADDRKLITFGLSDACDIQAKAIRCQGSSATFTIDSRQVHLPLPGRGNIENAIAAWAVCRQFGLSVEDFAQALRTLPAVAMRAELLQIGTLTVLNDCYNANPASMNNALDIVTQIVADENRRLVFVCGDMAELAEHSHKYHDQLGRQIANAQVKLLLAVGEFAKTTAEAAKTNANYDLQTKCFEDAAAVCNNLEKVVEHGDVVLIKGSRAAGLEKVVKRIEELFSPTPSIQGDAG